MTPERTKDLLQQYGVGPIQFSGTNDALYERHLIFDHLVDVNRPMCVSNLKRPLVQSGTSFRSDGC